MRQDLRTLPPQPVTPDDPRLVLYRSVADPDLARAHNLFVAEGRLVVRRILADPRYQVRSLLLNVAAHRDLDPVLARLETSVPVFICKTEDFRAVTGFNIHRGCLALVERPAPRAIRDVLAGARRIVLLEAFANADNVGGVFRNAAAFGADAVVLSPDSCDPLYRKAIRTSMAAVLRVPFVRSDDWSADLERIRAAGFMLVALTPSDTAESIDAFADRAGTTKLALAFGAEGTGLSETAIAAADARVRIPIAGGVDSLNVAVAAGIALYAVRGVRL
jgi:tRNA G18 (ribose-2'-O)-methylase SpoU